jgi:hypothetical protein
MSTSRPTQRDVRIIRDPEISIRWQDTNERRNPYPYPSLQLNLTVATMTQCNGPTTMANQVTAIEG